MAKLPGINQRVMVAVVAVGLGVLAVVVANQWVTQQRQVLETERKKLMANYQQPIEVVVAARDLPEGTVLEASYLRAAAVPEKFVQPYAARNPRDLVGKTIVAAVAEGEQILLNKVRRPDEGPVGGTLSSLTPKGKRAVTIVVDTITGVGGFVRPGDIVDILWTLKLPQGGQPDGQLVTLTLFQDVPVLAVGSQIVGQRAAQPKEGESTSQFTVTLALTPQETSFLLFARDQGRIQLSLRPKSDSGSQVAVAPANIQTLLETQLGLKQTQAPPSPPEKATREVEVYKGLKRDIVVLSEEQ